MVITVWYLAPLLRMNNKRKRLSYQPGAASNEQGLTGVDALTRLLMREGIIFFIALTSTPCHTYFIRLIHVPLILGVNVLNLIFFRLDNANLQSGAATLGQSVTMIFSEKFILDLSGKHEKF